MSTWTVFCDPATGQTLRSDFSSGFNAGVIAASAHCSAILGGIPSATPTNHNNADLSVILMGDSNVINTFGSANGCYNTIGNGFRNTVCGCYTNIFNGDQNYAFGQWSSIVNGNENCICGDYTFVGGGNTKLRLQPCGACGVLLYWWRCAEYGERFRFIPWRWG